MMFSENFKETLKKSQIGYSPERFLKISIIFGLLFSIALSVPIFIILSRTQFPIYHIAWIFLVIFFIMFKMIGLLPVFSIQSRKRIVESDLLYSARHLLIRLESGSSLINSLESVAHLRTNSSVYFRQLVFDISMGMPVEEAIAKAIEYSPSKAYTNLLEEIHTSLKTGADIQKTMKATLDNITREHLIMIQEYGKKLNPMSMFYMIIGTILPSLGTAMMIVASSLLSNTIVIDMRILLFISSLILMVQIFFVIAFRALKPPVMT